MLDTRVKILFCSEEVSLIDFVQKFQNMLNFMPIVYNTTHAFEWRFLVILLRSNSDC